MGSKESSTVKTPIAVSKHWSDCAIYNGPAYEAGACDCGGLELGDDLSHGTISALVTGPGGLRRFVDEADAESIVEAHELPADRLVMHATASELPAPHDQVTGARTANGVNLAVLAYPCLAYAVYRLAWRLSEV